MVYYFGCGRCQYYLDQSAVRNKYSCRGEWCQCYIRKTSSVRSRMSAYTHRNVREANIPFDVQFHLQTSRVSTAKFSTKLTLLWRWPIPIFHSMFDVTLSREQSCPSPMYDAFTDLRAGDVSLSFVVQLYLLTRTTSRAMSYSKLTFIWR